MREKKQKNVFSEYSLFCRLNSEKNKAVKRETVGKK